MKTFKKAFYFPLLFLLSTFFSTSCWGALHSFDLINPDNTKNIRGNYTIAGNTVMCLTDRYSGYGGTCGDAGYEYRTSNGRVSKYIDIDDDNSTWNSSSSYVTLPATFDTTPTRSILWAGLFWQGRISTDTVYAMHYGEEDGSGGYDLIETGKGVTYGTLDMSTTGASDIKFKVDNGNYVDAEADTFYEYESSGGTTYAAFSDVTDIVNAGIQTDGKHTFTVANLTTNEGREESPGVFGGWSMVVIYAENPTGKMRNISIFSGFDIVGRPSPAFTISDFILPRSGDVHATLSLFSGEGEYLYGYTPYNTSSYDWIKISDTGVSTDYDYMPDAAHDKNIFDAVLTGITRDDISGHSNNLQINNNGVDIDNFDVSSLMTTYRDRDPDLHTMYIQWSSNNDYITPSMIAFATELYVPKFCYDYAYKQQGKYFTESNNGSNDPRIVGDVLTSEDVNVTVFIRNLVDSDIDVTDMYVDIFDINTTQAKYVRQSTHLAIIPNIIPEPIPDSDLLVTDSSIRDIDIGTISSNDYFYIYYTLDPAVSNLDMPLSVTANYNLTIDNITIPYNLVLGAHIELCSTSNFDYTPVEGRFNIVHNDYYNDSFSYYNLPTQVTSREGNFKVISLDPDDLNTLQAIPNNTKVAVEMISMAGFHDTFTACKELDSAITPRVWVTIDANSTSSPFNSATLFEASQKLNADYGASSELPNGWDFYKKANENTAFRVSFNLDDNESFILQWAEDNATTPPKYTILNFPSAAQTGECSHPVNFTPLHGGTKTNVTRAATACGNAGTAISESQFDACNECLYGKNTALVCSRDNFSIRPEALLVKLDDQDQVNPTVYQRLDEDGKGIISGVINPTDRVLDVAAGYNYRMEVNATNHRGNEASLKYTKTYGIINDDKAHFVWDYNNSILDSNDSLCNDKTNHEFEIRFLDGYVETDIFVDQVGRYRLNKTDKEWTTVDSNPTFMTHHTGSNFLSSNTPDCILGSASTQTVGVSNGMARPLQGCEIWSEHNSSFIPNGSPITDNLKYRDYKLESHPYFFNVEKIIPTVGLDHTAVTSNSYVYMADMSFNNNQDQNMSYHLNGFILPQGYNESNLSNFVDGCFAKALDINVSINGDTALTDTLGNQIVYQSKFHDINSTTDSEITALTLDANYTTPVSFIQISTGQNYFKKDFDGSMETRLNLNYHRDLNVSVNPKEISFMNYDVDCNDSANNCTFKADMIQNKTTQGTKDLNSSIAIKHYYGRTHAPRNRFVGPTGNAFIYYEVFCNGVGCDKTLLQNGHNSRVTDDPRWFRNEAHVVASHGSAGAADGSDITQKNAANVTTGTLDNNTTLGQTTAPLTYNENRGYPYKATMENNASGFLIYNKYDTTNTSSTNEFEVEFVNTDGNWAGKADSSATTREIGSKKTNRRSMW